MRKLFYSLLRRRAEFLTGSRQIFLLSGLLWALGLGSPAARAQSPGLSFTFALPHAYTTSAGVYAADGRRVRVLWKKVAYEAGSHTVRWDGKDEAGANVPASTYTVKVLYHNRTYTWEGVIGNTSATFAGYDKTWHLNSPLPDLAITPDGRTAYAANGYAEGKPSASRFATANPQVPTALLYYAASNGHLNTGQELAYVATDGTRVYYAQIGNGWRWDSFVLAINASDDSPAVFANGQAYQTPRPFERYYPSVIDLREPDPSNLSVNPITGLAVQRTGSLLAVAHGRTSEAAGANEVRLFDKTTGAPRGTIPFADPGRLAFAPNGDLWIISASGRYVERRSHVGTTNDREATITGLARPLGVAVNPTNGQVLVSDGGSSQQIKGYDPAGTLQWTLGDLGGYATDPAVTNTKFHLDAPVAYGDRTPGQGAGFVTAAPDGSFWVGDTGNERHLHFAADHRTYLEQIAFLGLMHTCTVDVNDPTRVFSEELLEFQMDYTKPLQPGDPDPAHGGNGSWKLVRNWAASAPANFSRDLTSVATLPNGHTYGLLFNPRDPAPHNPFAENWSVVELPARGPLRDTQVRLKHMYDPSDSGTDGYIYPNGDLRYRDNPGNGPTQHFYRQALGAFDGNNNPSWQSAQLIATAPARPLAYRTYPITSSGVLAAYYPFGVPNSVPFGSSQAIRYDGGNGDLLYHLGGVPLNSPVGMAWVDMKPIDNDGIPSGQDHTPPDGLGGVGQRAYGGLTGTVAFAAGQHILGYYNGQGNMMSNQWSDWWDDGLFVGQFGQPDAKDKRALAPHEADGNSLEATPGNAYNATRPAVAQYAGTTYAFLADESNHSGVHRWRLAGQAREISGSGSLGSTVALGPAGAWPEPNLVLNPSFEAEGATPAPTGWAKTEGAGSAGAATSAASNDARSFPNVGRHALATAYQAYTYQVLKELPNGTYTLSAWVRSSGGQSTAVLLARNYGAAPVQANIPAGAVWQRITLSGIAVTNGSCEIGFQSVASGGQWLEVDDMDLRAASPLAAGRGAGAGPQVGLYPNPSAGSTTRLWLRGLAGQALTVQVLDVLGRPLATQALTPAADLAEAPLRLPPATPPGLYLVRVSDGARAWTARWLLAP